MRLTKIALIVTLAAAVLLGTVACSSSQLRKQADIHQGIGNTAESAAVRIETALQTGADLRTLADSPDFAAIRNLFPQVDQIITEANAKGDDLRPVFEQLVVDLRATAGENIRQADILRAKADDTSLTEFDRFGAAVTGGLSAINPIIGSVVGLIVGGVGAWRRGQASGAAQVAAVINKGRTVPEFNDLFSGQAGVNMAAELAWASKPVQKAVKETKIKGASA